MDNLQADIATLKAQQPQLANVEIQVEMTTLGRVIEGLKTQTDPNLNLIQFVPQRSGTPSQPNTPQNQPTNQPSSTPSNSNN